MELLTGVKRKKKKSVSFFMEIYHQKKYWKLKHFTFTGSLSYNHNNCVPQESNKYGQKDIFKLLETRKLAEQLR